MGCPVPVFCKHCGDALDVYEPPERRFCSEDCAMEYILYAPEAQLRADVAAEGKDWDTEVATAMTCFEIALADALFDEATKEK